jgi:hypothetical protein
MGPASALEKNKVADRIAIVVAVNFIGGVLYY